MSAHPVTTHQRLIHLDFHTSPYIPGVGENFDPDVFADTMAEANVNSVCVFAKCHHGMHYYPSKLGPVHPHLERPDLLGDMIEALHKRGIRAPIYTTIGWEEHWADIYPQWRQMKSNGSYANIERSADEEREQPGKWRFMCWAHPEFQDAYEAHLEELISNYDVDGFFIDIMFMHPEACFNEGVMPERERLGLTADTLKNNALFESYAQQQFAQRFSKFISSKAPQATIFFNSPNKAFTDHAHGWAERSKYATHVEVESLPSGLWGYQHFPRLAREAMMWEAPFFGMTGKFQRMWGDFGGIKPQAALDYECFRMQALGGASSVGDQMFPDGTLDKGTYARIGSTFAKLAEAEPFYADTAPCPQGAVVLASGPHSENTMIEEGAVLMFEELKYDVAVVNDASDISSYDFVVLPDAVHPTELLIEKLKAYYQAGGTIILSNRSGFAYSDKNDGAWLLDFLPIEHEGKETNFPNYWMVTDAIGLPELEGDCRVIYSQGMKLKASGTTLIERVPTFFNRTDIKFCSHFQTPPNLEADRSPAALLSERVIAFADPIFWEYRDAGSVYLREMLAAAMTRAGIKPQISGNMDPHVVVYPRRIGEDLRLTLLNYMPSRKCLAIDVIERGLSYAGQTIGFDRQVNAVRVWNQEGTGEELTNATDGSYNLPVDAAGRLLLEVPGFFA